MYTTIVTVSAMGIMLYLDVMIPIWVDRWTGRKNNDTPGK